MIRTPRATATTAGVLPGLPVGELGRGRTRSAGAEADEAGRWLPFQGRGEGGRGCRPGRDGPVVADHGGHRRIVGDPGDAGDYGRGTSGQPGRGDGDRLVAGPD